MLRSWFGIVALAIGLSLTGGAQNIAPPPPAPLPPAPSTASAEPGSELTVTLLTFGLGDEVFERFGHNALWFHDAFTAQDVAYHWGLFSFLEPHFVLRFLTGENRYWMGAEDVHALIARAQAIGRPVTLQRLKLTPLQALKLRDFARWNALEENKFYRYDYFQDNCSTRLRDALDMALGGVIKRSLDTAHTALSYRRESVRLTDGARPVQTGIDIALGRRADAPLTAWDSFFIPMRLRDALRTIRVPGARGGTVPLVASEEMVPLPPTPAPIPELTSAPSLALRCGILGGILALVVVGLRIMMVTRRSAAWGLALFGGAWSLVCGTIGVILPLAWFFTRHVFWAANENVLLFSPISLALVVLIPAAVLSGRQRAAARVIGAVAAIAAICALVLAIIPGGQESKAIVALVLPVHLALAWAIGMARSTSVAPGNVTRTPLALQ